MVAELGQVILLLALALSVVQGGAPFAGWRLRRAGWLAASLAAARAQFVFLLAALGLLAALFYNNDFSVLYVAQNSSADLPAAYRIAAVWGGHEGSLLLWCAMLALWTLPAAVFTRRMPLLLRAQVAGVMGWLSAGFLALLIFTSNPFARIFPAPAAGRDLNPLLQDPGMIVHPPMLYMGYVGFSVVFAFAVAALLNGKMDSAWARAARLWALAAWAFLTLGILLGSAWAYYELGWGGWWFWDPVENASFMPWLLGTALLHSLAASEARGLFKPWTALLAIFVFILCLLGAFLVRSGVLTSVHTFAADPKRGLFILALLFVFCAAALGLYAWRAPRLAAAAGAFAPVSRESGILLNNVLLSAAAVCVLLGTLYPLLLDALGGGKISVGPPYFNKVFVPLAGASAFLAAAGGLTRWKNDAMLRLLQKLSWPFLFAVLAGALFPLQFGGEYSAAAAAGFALAFWIAFATFRAAIDSWRGKITKSIAGMLTAHFGVAVFILGVTAVSAYEEERDVLLQTGAAHLAGSYEYELAETKNAAGENYDAIIAAVRVLQNGKQVAEVYPEKRTYRARPDNQMTEAGIAAGWRGDWYVSLGEERAAGAWSARVQYKPFVRWIWAGALLMMLGGFLAAADKRYRERRGR